MRVVALIAAHNEEYSILQTIESLLYQTYILDDIIIVADNCTDNTAELVRSIPGITVFETINNKAKKPGALNQGWHRYCRDADLIVCLDADTTIGPNAVNEWVQEFAANPKLGGCSGKFTMMVSESMSFTEKLLVRLQRAEFSKWTDMALRRKRRTSVLAGTACCVRNQALREIWILRGDGPWIETSLVEDFELTYRMRQLGWQTKVSAEVRAYTDAMTTFKSLWAQRMKWQTGTVNDLLKFGINRLTLFDWWQQIQGLIAIIVRLLWLILMGFALATGNFHLHLPWLIPPVIFMMNDIKQAFRIPHASRADIFVAALMIPQELFAFMRAGWFALSWWRVLKVKALKISSPDLWLAQDKAEKTRRIRA